MTEREALVKELTAELDTLEPATKRSERLYHTSPKGKEP